MAELRDLPDVYRHFLAAVPTDAETARQIEGDLTGLRELAGGSLAFDTSQSKHPLKADLPAGFVVLGPMLYRLWQSQFRAQPRGSGGYKEWLKQPGVDISRSMANDIVHFWTDVVPVCGPQGLNPFEFANELGIPKLRVLVPAMRRAKAEAKALASSGQRSASTEAQLGNTLLALIEQAKQERWRELSRGQRRRVNLKLDQIVFARSPADAEHWHVRTKRPLTAAQVDYLKQKLPDIRWEEEVRRKPKPV